MKTSTPLHPINPTPLNGRSIHKGVLLTCLFFLTASSVFAQDSYFKFSVGYGLPAGSQLLGENSSSTGNLSTGAHTANEKGIYGSLGSGFVANASYGHMYSKNIGLDIGLQYLIGKKYDSHQTSTYVDFYGVTNRSSNGSSISARGLLLSPTAIFSAGQGTVRPYTKIGFVLGVMKFATEDTYAYSNQKFEMKTEFKGGLSFGFRGGVGLDFSASKKVNFFTEVMFTSMSYYPHESEITKYKVNGTDQEPLQRKVTYEKEVTTSAASDSSKQLRFAAPFGNFVLSFGIKINIAKHAAGQTPGS